RPNRRQGLIPIALRQIALGRPVTQFGDGSMVRDYLYTDDLVSMVMAMVGVASKHDLYNIGSGTGYSLLEVFGALRRVTGQDFEIVEAPRPSTFVDRVVLNTDRYTSEFGSQQLTPLDEGIERTWRDMGGGADA
ncbi:MAG TPA: NAD-dependent epimerase/dehydratase family protein, partial [Pseudolysinimonas sp.]|nr:NAD-dependent epimerase/dehydratase family protein [Pseudolysinimonas sp.]